MAVGRYRGPMKNLVLDDWRLDVVFMTGANDPEAGEPLLEFRL
jgi:hypothetical protein